MRIFLFSLDTGTGGLLAGASAFFWGGGWVLVDSVLSKRRLYVISRRNLGWQQQLGNAARGEEEKGWRMEDGGGYYSTAQLVFSVQQRWDGGGPRNQGKKADAGEGGGAKEGYGMEFNHQSS